jgi:hypothetical protein
VSFTDLDYCKQSVYFESILTTFEARFIFYGGWGSSKNWLELKIEPPLSNLASLRKSVKNNVGNEARSETFIQFLKKVIFHV